MCDKILHFVSHYYIMRSFSAAKMSIQVLQLRNELINVRLANHKPANETKFDPVEPLPIIANLLPTNIHGELGKMVDFFRRAQNTHTG